MSTTHISIIDKLEPPRVSAVPGRTYTVLYVDTPAPSSTMLSIHFEAETLEDSVRAVAAWAAKLVAAADDALLGVQTAARELATASLYDGDDLWPDRNAFIEGTEARLVDDG